MGTYLATPTFVWTDKSIVCPQYCNTFISEQIHDFALFTTGITEKASVICVKTEFYIRNSRIVSLFGVFVTYLESAHNSVSTNTRATKKIKLYKNTTIFLFLLTNRLFIPSKSHLIVSRPISLKRVQNCVPENISFAVKQWNSPTNRLAEWRRGARGDLEVRGSSPPSDFCFVSML